MMQDSGSNESGSHRSSVALPRDHSYLEASHPLLPEPDLLPISSTSPLPSTSSSSNIKINSSSSSTLELAVLELHGVVLFPGSTIPVKLRNRSVIRYLGRQIRLCRKDPSSQPVVRLGILPFVEPTETETETAAILSTLRRSFLEGESASHRRPSQQHRSDTLPRAAWMPRNPGASGSFSGNSFGHRAIWRDTGGSTSASTTSHASRRGLTRLTDGFGSVDAMERLLRGDSSSDSGSESDSDSGDPERDRKDAHSLVGRIGTIATVRHTHERTGSSGSSDETSSLLWGNYEDATELVLTAVGTSRFRIVSCLHDKVFAVEELRDGPLARPSVPGRSLPRAVSDSRIDDDNDNDDDDDDDNDNNGSIEPASTRMWTPADTMAWNMSVLTPIPYFVHQKWTPWSLVESIAHTLRSQRGRITLPSLGGEDSIVARGEKLEPISFAYWMANNAPFSEDEKRALLAMDSVMERLLFAWNKVREWTEANAESDLCCSACGSPKTCVSEIFAVGGAEGTTSAYVNGQGYIHQVITLRHADEGQMFQRGAASTENSYFPGYSWTILQCRTCYSQLGWKFKKVYNTPSTTPDTIERPGFFYGFLSSSIKLKSRLRGCPPPFVNSG